MSGQENFRPAPESADFSGFRRAVRQGSRPLHTTCIPHEAVGDYTPQDVVLDQVIEKAIAAREEEIHPRQKTFIPLVPVEE